MAESGADLMHTLTRHGLVDQYRIWVEPIVVGGGERLFKGDGETRVLRLVQTETFSTGVVVLTYEPARGE